MSQHTVEECDEQIKDYWEAYVRTDDPDEKILFRDFVNNWLEIRHNLINEEGRVEIGTGIFNTD